MANNTRGSRGGKLARSWHLEQARSHNGNLSDSTAKNHKNVHSFLRHDDAKVMADSEKYSLPSGAFNPR